MYFVTESSEEEVRIFNFLIHSLLLISGPIVLSVLFAVNAFSFLLFQFGIVLIFKVEHLCVSLKISVLEE